MKVLEICNISKSYGNKKVLDNFSFSMESGEIVSIIGDSGAGKSTLLRIINGLEKIDSGYVKVNNNIVDKNTKAFNLDVGMVFQDFNLFPNYNALNNITLPLIKVLKVKKEDAIIKAKKLLKQMNLLKRINSYPCELSGGEKQRLAIARTLVSNPKVICFDEPTSALDSKLIDDIYNIIKELAYNNKGILIVTHDINFAKRISDRIIKFECIDK